ncbi:hypothetical protein AMAG_07166 [Allomyces macrogynus ATCC 38327]|uniref:Piwi domain-containing protein n=1 Tax=Allomyces macrogynus (strain ATCC 38327) TaxID=578462 RepID=A0A0L0SHG8_ALLM3|nr:hypothetical protein AMAG_07166 [Allomyces macrogynus ATCC 38327]|eukprot:KNE61897.1 hypothetical protein AMAG_07166 [Allomyces macrogynus ATCC 38327]
MMRLVQQRLATAPYITKSFVPRPGFGKAGIRTKVIANHFKFTKIPTKTIYHYDVVVNPEPSKMVMAKVWNQWEAQANAVVVFDGVKNAYSSHVVLPGEVTVTLPPNPDAPPTRRVPKDFKVTLTKVKELNLAELDAYVAGKVKINEHILACIQAMDIVFRHLACKTMVAVGRNFFARSCNPTPLSDGLELWSGLFQSVRPGHSVMTLNVDTAYTAFYQAVPVVQFACKVNPQLVPNQGLIPRDRFKLELLLRQVVTVATHRRDSKLRYRVLRLTLEGADKCMFMYTPAEGGVPQPLSVAQYFKTKYGILLQYPKLPCLVVGTPEKSVMLPMECATIAPDQKFRGKLDEYQTAEMIRTAAKPPVARQAEIMHLFASLRLRENRYLQAFGIEVEGQPMAVDARILAAPEMAVGRGRCVVAGNGVWQMGNQHVANPARITALGVLSFCDTQRASEGQITGWMQDGLSKTAEGMGIMFSPVDNKKAPIRFARNNPGDAEAALRAVYQETENTFNQVPQLIVCLMPGKSAAMYAKIKHIGDTVLGVPTQCLLLNKVTKPGNKQYWSNVLLKINAKVSGAYINFRLAQSRFFTESTMLVGADVTHPAPGTDQPSIACMVASLTSHSADRYATVTRKQPRSRQEELSDCAEMFEQLLHAYLAKSNQLFPKRVLFYRDGVSEGQFAAVNDIEVRAIKGVLDRLGARETKLTFIVMQKRHHTRFFADKMGQGTTDKTGNLKAGTVVDRDVTDPANFDFFLQSHAAVQGTARPTRYVVLHDEVQWTADDLQQFTYHLCYTYARCTRSVSVVPPAFYAHLACSRARHHLAGRAAGSAPGGVGSAGIPMVSDKLEESMYFM